MTIQSTRIARALATVALGTGLIVAALPAASQPGGERGQGPRAQQMTDAQREQMRERMQQRMNQRLDRMAARLEIKASQQAAWDAYRKAITAAPADRVQRPGRDADAATLTRFRAEMAQRRAQRMATVADATAQLQQALEPDQRKVLDEMSRRAGQRGQGMKRGGSRGGHGEHHGRFRARG